MQRELEQIATIRVLLEGASDYEAPRKSSFQWKEDAYLGLANLLNETIKVAVESFNEDNARAFKRSLQAVDVLLECIVHALLEHTHVKQTHDFVASFQQEFLDDLRFAFYNSYPRLISVRELEEEVERCICTWACLPRY